MDAEEDLTQGGSAGLLLQRTLVTRVREPAQPGEQGLFMQLPEGRTL